MSHVLAAYIDINWHINNAFRMMGWFDTARTGIFLVVALGLLILVVRRYGRRTIFCAIGLGVLGMAVLQLIPNLWRELADLDDLHAHGGRLIDQWPIFWNVIAFSEGLWLVAAVPALGIGLHLHRRYVAGVAAAKTFD